MMQFVRTTSFACSSPNVRPDVCDKEIIGGRRCSWEFALERLWTDDEPRLLLISERRGKHVCFASKQNRVEFFGVEALDNCLA
jgi:hypothetical protein